MGTNGTHRWLPCKVPSLPNSTTLKGWPHLRGPHPLPFPNSGGMWVLLHPTDQWKCWETRPTVFHPYPRRRERETICSCHYKGRTFFAVILRPWVLVRSGFEPTTSCSAAWCCPNQANQTAVNKMQGQIYKNGNLDIDWSNTHQSHMFTNYSSYSY